MWNLSRRGFLQQSGMAAALLGTSGIGRSEEIIQGFEETTVEVDSQQPWEQKYERKIRVGIAGFGLCEFGAVFGFQDHPNVEVAAVTDLIPERCRGLAKATRCEKTYPSLEEMVNDDSLEAIYCATDAPSHADLCILAMNHGKHVATAVPAVFGNVEDAYRVYETVKKTGLNYMMFETSFYHAPVYAMRQLYNEGKLGKIIYSEGEYYHYMPTALASYKDWRVGLPPQYYPTHSNAYYCGVSGGSFTEVSCMGMRSIVPHLTADNNRYKNPFGTEVALFRTSEGGMARMAVSWDTPGNSGEMGRVRGEKGSFYTTFEGLDNVKIPLKPQLPGGVSAGGHGGSHGYLMNEFVMSILEKRRPLIDVSMSLNMTVAGIVAHQSALKDGQLMAIPQFAGI
jgi:predicted dehydrogenase